jgi:hypothetical protein
MFEIALKTDFSIIRKKLQVFEKAFSSNKKYYFTYTERKQMMATTTTLTMSANTINSNEVSGALSYPRTGKRGVPQQFPRRLYTMLQSESSLEDANLDPQKNPLILWSESGQAFRITNIEQFSTHVLPKYFRTSKFSSFQRNLNLVSRN